MLGKTGQSKQRPQKYCDNCETKPDFLDKTSYWEKDCWTWDAKKNS